MKRFILLSTLFVLGSTPFQPKVLAEEVQNPSIIADLSDVKFTQLRTPESLIDDLEDQGYTILGSSKTLLGRIRIRAKNNRHKRILVLAPATGEILSDRIMKPSTITVSFGDRERDSSDVGSNWGSASDEAQATTKEVEIREAETPLADPPVAAADQP